MRAPEFALQHALARKALAARVGAYADSLWLKVNPADIVASWLDLIPNLLPFVVGAQLKVAGQADAYLAEAATAEGIGAASEFAVSAAAFAGTAADGRDLASLLYQPAIATLSALKDGSGIASAMASGRANLSMIVRTEVADAGRNADHVALTGRRELTGYVRVIVGATCSRCTVLAGRWYRYNEGFNRHPRCDCIHLPSSQAHAVNLIQDPNKLYADLSPAERTKAGWSKADQEAIANGADLNQVTNAKRGTYLSGGKQYTREGTTKRGLYGGYQLDDNGVLRKRVGKAPARLTPNQIFAQARSREEAIQLLRDNAYLLKAPTRIAPSLAARPAVDVSRITGKMTAAERKALARQLVEGEYAGLRVKVVSVEHGGSWSVEGSRYTTVNGHLRNAKGAKVGEVVRTFEDIRLADGTTQRIVHHELLTIDPEFRGQGFATQFNRHLEASYRLSGITEIHLTANIDVGGFAWSRQGYDWAKPRSADRIANRIEQRIAMVERDSGLYPGSHTASLLGSARSLMDRLRTGTFGEAGYPTPYEVSQLGRWDGAGRDDHWFGKDVLLGSSWDGVKYL